MSLRPGAPEEVGMRPEQIARARDLCAGWVEQGHTPAINLLVARRGRVVLDEAYGQLRPGDDSPPLRRDSVHPLLSLTKPFTAALIMQLVDAGLLALNRPVADYLPEVGRDETREILVHHLLTHTSGWPDYDAPSMNEHAAAIVTARGGHPPCPENRHPQVHELMHLFIGAPLAQPPGAVMQYSDLNYLLLGEIVAAVSGRSLAEQARLQLFEPLGMVDSHYIVPPSLYDRLAERPTESVMGSSLNPFMQGADSEQWRSFPVGGGGMYSTARDIALFGQAILDRGRGAGARILSPAAVDAMTRDQIPDVAGAFLGRLITPASWGYGFIVESTAKWRYLHGSLFTPGTVHHPGHTGTKLWIDREREIVGVYLEVLMRETEEGELLWNCDLFENAINASVES